MLWLAAFYLLISHQMKNVLVTILIFITHIYTRTQSKLKHKN